MYVPAWILTGLLATVGIILTAVGQKTAVETAPDITVVFYTHLFATPIVISAFLLTRPFTIPTTPGIVLPLLASIGFNVISFYLFAAALSTDDLSIVFSLRNTTPFIVAVLEPFIVVNTQFDITTVLAGSLAVLGIFILLSSDDILSPLYRIRDRGPQLALASAFIISGAIIADRTALTTQPTIDPVTYAAYLITGMALIMGMFATATGSLAFPREQTLALGVSGIGRSTSVIAAISTLAIATGGQFAVLAQLATIGVVIIGAYQFDEPYLLYRIIGACCIVTGVGLSTL